MARDRSTPVPHHLVEAALYDRAAQKAADMGLSMSKVAAKGLDAYAAEASHSLTKAAKKDAEGDLTPEPATQTLPRETQEDLLSMHSRRDPLLNAFLAALAQAGWSYATLGEPLGVSRQAIYDRVRKWRGLDIPEQIPDVPPPPFRMPAPYSLGYERVDWPIWIDRETYAICSRESKRRMEPMRVVMENILRDFINDTGPWRPRDE